MKFKSIKINLISAFIGAYVGTFVTTGLSELIASSTGDFFGWLSTSSTIATVISLPLSILLIFTLVPMIFKLFNFNVLSVKNYIIVGIISGSIPIILIFIIYTLVNIASINALTDLRETAIVFSILLLYAVIIGATCLTALWLQAYNKSLNRTRNKTRAR